MNDAPLNIIYIVCHDTGREIGCYGRKIATPHLDAFASEGIRFTNMYCSSPACAPSRSCAYSGLPAHLNGQMGVTPSGYILSPHIPTVVDYFNRGGYETVHIGFQHERYRSIENRYQVEKGSGKLNLVENGVDAVIDYLKARQPSDKPFYLNMGTMENHCVMWQQRGHNRHEVYGNVPPDQVDYPTWFPEYGPLRQEIGNFQACIHYFDTHIGRLLDAIDQLGYRNNTLVVICTDHGISGERGKGTLYDHGTEMFFLARLPDKIAPNQVSDALLPNMDIAPTLLEAAGLPVPGTMHGKSFWPLMTGGNYTPHDFIVMERNYHGDDYPDIMRAVRSKDYLYIRNFSPHVKHPWTKEECPPLHPEYKAWFTEMWPWATIPREREEMFSVKDDPDQFHSIASDPAVQDAKKDLSDKLDDYMKRTGDPALYGEIISVASMEKAAGRHMKYREEHLPLYTEDLLKLEPSDAPKPPAATAETPAAT